MWTDFTNWWGQFYRTRDHMDQPYRHRLYVGSIDQAFGHGGGGVVYGLAIGIRSICSPSVLPQGEGRTRGFYINSYMDQGWAI